MKKAGFIIVTLTLMLVLIACGGSDDGDNSGTDGDNSNDSALTTYCKNLIAKTTECETEVDAYVEEEYGTDVEWEISSQADCEDYASAYEETDDNLDRYATIIKNSSCSELLDMAGAAINIIEE